MSVTEFFRRKCDSIGKLSNSELRRPNLGIPISSPKRNSKLIPLVDSTITSEATSLAQSIYQNKDSESFLHSQKDIDEQSLISLSTIAQALQNNVSGTPRELIDKLIMAKKKKRQAQAQGENTISKTFTIDRKSLPITPGISSSIHMRDAGILSQSGKLSLDSKKISGKQTIKRNPTRMLSFESEVKPVKSVLNVPNAETFGTMETKSDLSSLYKTKSEISLPEKKPAVHKTKLFHLSACNNSKDSLSTCPSKLKTSVFQEDVSNKLKPQNELLKDSIKTEDILLKNQTRESSVYDDTDHVMIDNDIQSNSIVNTSTEELCVCVVGILRQTSISLINVSKRWLICSIKVNQAEEGSIDINIQAQENIILKPYGTYSIEIMATVLKMCKRIVAVFDLAITDAVTQSKWNVKQIICFVPEELQINVTTNSKTQELNFNYVTEYAVKTIPINIENKNNLDFLIRASSSQNESKNFFICNAEDPSRPEELLQTKSFMLKALEQNKLNIAFQASSGLIKDQEFTQPCRISGELNIFVQNGKDEILIYKLSLTALFGVCKIQVIDTELPVVIPKEQSKQLHIINIGTVPATVYATTVEDDIQESHVNYFSILPTNLTLQCREKGSFTISYKPPNIDTTESRRIQLKLTSDNKKYYYCIIGERKVSEMAANDNMSRCETPDHRAYLTSPTSPYSVTSSKSEMSGRHSPMSTTSGLTVSGQGIPIRSTHASLVWNSVKAGKFDIKEFTIRNTSNNKIKIQAYISDNNKSFKFLKELQTASSHIILVLQRMESRTLSVVFNPHHTGAAAGKIVFRHYEPKTENLTGSRPSKAIFLYGYGGSGKIEISEIFKDVSGKMWLSLGTLNPGGTLTARIRVKNVGDLCSYAKVELLPKAVYPAMMSSWNVEPMELLLRPQETQYISVNFQPKKEDVTRLQHTDVSHVGTLTLTYGDEPTRWRIRRLYKKAEEAVEFYGMDSGPFRNIVHPICTIFPGEQMLSDLNIIHDTTQNLGDLCRGVHQHEIMLTMEMHPDETLSLLHENADESQMFYSLCSDKSHFYEGNGKSFLPSAIESDYELLAHNTSEDYFIVEPHAVHILAPKQKEATVTIKSSCSIAQTYETVISNSEYLSVVPAEGMIPTRKALTLKIRLKKKIEHYLEALLEIFTENNKQQVIIRVSSEK
ncbi:uncharacterized protein spd-2 isoform X2 [Prorops nasuta]|uniref:uncharacterized protein spd-2 isoform X2 n=1 Tax=Prorops nasuta TaxID=863751 RepID=UPI0034CD16E8